MNSTINKFHERAVVASKNYKRAEGELLEAIQDVLRNKVYLNLGFASLFDYCVRALGLPEGVTYHFTAVAKKSLEVPELKAAITEGGLTVSQAKRLVPVIDAKNHQEWIKKGIHLTQRQLEKEVVMVNPKPVTAPTLKAINSETTKLNACLSDATAEKFKRIQSLLSQKMNRHVPLDAVLDILADEFLASALRRKAMKENPKTVTPNLKAEIFKNHDHQCTFTDASGHRCENTYFLQVHHIKAKAEGGDNRSENLRPLCSNHHKFLHEMAG